MSAKTPTLASLLESFFRNRLAAQRCASPATIGSYRDALRLLLIFASERAGKPPSRLSLEEIDREVVLAFLDHLEAERGNGIRTRNARLAAIRSFFQHVSYSDPASMGIAQRVLGIPGKRASKRVVSYLRQDELDAVLAAPDRIDSPGQARSRTSAVPGPHRSPGLRGRRRQWRRSAVREPHPGVASRQGPQGPGPAHRA